MAKTLGPRVRKSLSGLAATLVLAAILTTGAAAPLALAAEAKPPATLPTSQAAGRS